MCDCVCTLCTIHLSIQSPDSSAKAAIALTLLAVWFVTFAATVAQNRYLYISHLIPQKLVQAATKEQALCTAGLLSCIIFPTSLFQECALCIKLPAPTSIHIGSHVCHFSGGPGQLRYQPDVEWSTISAVDEGSSSTPHVPPPPFLAGRQVS
jgi:hypothetical protein